MSRRAGLFHSTRIKAPQISSGMQGGAVCLADLDIGRSARVLSVRGDAALAGRMAALGIVPGAVITKKSAIPARGPIVVVKGQVQLALSHDMGCSIFVEPTEEPR